MITWIQLGVLLLIGIIIGMSGGFAFQYWLAKRQMRRNQIAAWREKWRYRPDWELEDAVRNPEAFSAEARKAAQQLLDDRQRLLS
jgi:hypothetical protein